MKRIWWKEAVCYQIYPRSFKDSNGDGIGDINGIREKLDYLQDLGIDVIWICPIYKSPNDDNGYDISDYQAILSDFGTMEDFDDLLQEVHRRGMKLIMDLVINHTSDEHPWFIESRNPNSEKRDWYIWKDAKDGKEPNNWASIFEGSAWQYDPKSGQYFLHVFSKRQPDLNWENKEMRYALYDMINWWLDKGIDGFRVDAISHIKKSFELGDMENPDHLKYVPSFKRHMNQPGIQTYLEELKDQTFKNYDIMTVGEANGVTIEDSDEWVGEKNGKFNMVFQFEHLNLWDHNIGTKFDILGYKQVLAHWQKGLENRGWNALFIENHDRPRVVSTWGNDQEYWYESATSHATAYFLQQGTPFIYQGQEIGMTNYPFKDIHEFNDVHAKNIYEEELMNGMAIEDIMHMLSRISRDNSRTPMQWDDSEHAGFTTGRPWLKVNPNYKTINVENESRQPRSILNFYKALIQFKKDNLVMTYGTFDLVFADQPKVFAYTRTWKNEKVLVLANLDDTHETLVKSVEDLHVTSDQLLLHNYDVDSIPSSTIELRPYEARVYRLS